MLTYNIQWVEYSSRFMRLFYYVHVLRYVFFFALFCYYVQFFYNLCREKSVSRLSRNEKKYGYQSKIDLDRQKKSCDAFHQRYIINIKCKFLNWQEKMFWIFCDRKSIKNTKISCNDSRNTKNKVSKFGCLIRFQFVLNSHRVSIFLSFDLFSLPLSLRYISFHLWLTTLHYEPNINQLQNEFDRERERVSTNVIITWSRVVIFTI